MTMLSLGQSIVGAEFVLLEYGSSAFHEPPMCFFGNLGFESLCVQYWPQTSTTLLVEDDCGLRIFFWARRHEIGWSLLKGLLGSTRPERIIFRVAADPGQVIDLPNPSDIEQYRVELISGWMDKTRYVELLRSCTVFMAPRLHEGIGQAFLEAMASGLAVIAPDSPTMNEYIIHNRNGYLYSFINPIPLEFSSLLAVRRRAFENAAAGHSRWRADAARILAFIMSEPKQSATLRWRFAGWRRRLRDKSRATANSLSRRS